MLFPVCLKMTTPAQQNKPHMKAYGSFWGLKPPPQQRRLASPLRRFEAQPFPEEDEDTLVLPKARVSKLPEMGSPSHMTRI